MNDNNQTQPSEKDSWMARDELRTIRYNLFKTFSPVHENPGTFAKTAQVGMLLDGIKHPDASNGKLGTFLEKGGEELEKAFPLYGLLCLCAPKEAEKLRKACLNAYSDAANGKHKNKIRHGQYTITLQQPEYESMQDIVSGRIKR